jgi:hypothetical protein
LSVVFRRDCTAVAAGRPELKRRVWNHSFALLEFWCASLRCAPACGARKDLFQRSCGTTTQPSARFDHPSARKPRVPGPPLWSRGAKHSHALTLVSLCMPDRSTLRNRMWCSERGGIPPFAKTAKDGAPTALLVKEKREGGPPAPGAPGAGPSTRRIVNRMPPLYLRFPDVTYS